MDDFSDELGQKGWALRTLAELFPQTCGVACAIEQDVTAPLPEAEAIAVKAAVETRKSTFAAGRAAAREALRKIGFSRSVIPAGTDRAPIWPTGAIGSIAHADGVAVAVAARLDDLSALGVDIEKTAAVSSDLWRDLMVAEESAFLISLPEAERGRFATAIFCVKEAFYKFQYPHTHKWIDFRDVEVEIDKTASTWKLKTREPLLVGGAKTIEFRGGYRIGNSFTIAAAY